MNKLIFAALLSLTVLICACGPKTPPGFKLEEGTPDFDLARELSAKLPILDPAANAVLLKSDSFQITVGDLIRVFRSNMGNRAEQMKNAELEQLRQVVQRNVQLLGERKLLMAEAEKAGTEVERSQLDAALQEQYQQAGGEDKFREMLAEGGVAYEYVESSIAEGLRIQNFLNSVLEDKLQVTDEEIQEIYQKDKTASVRHVLLLTQDKSDEEKAEIRSKMEEILEQARKGEDFAALAEKYSEDPGSRENGGLYEDFGRGRMVKPFEDAAFGVPVGEISGIVETQYGYHILKIVDRKKESRPFEEVKSEIASQLRQEKESGILQSYLDGLKEEAGWIMTEF